MEPYIGEIKLVPYNFAPRGWAFCQGQLMAISQNDALFSLLGTTYGGDGQLTFGLPDLRGRVAVGMGTGPGLPPMSLGETGGTESETLSLNAIPSHGHGTVVSADLGTVGDPAGALPARSPMALGYAYGTSSSGSMGGDPVQVEGGSQPHENRQPFTTLNYVIALEGIYPSPN